MTKPSDIQLSHLQSFIDSLWLESGLSDNTVTAYQHDLVAFASWLQPFDVTLTNAEREHIQRYLQQRMRDGKKVRSDARLLSS
ncbi:MAG TPA: site-specific tyrosine recombinase XerD, partial [Methylophaga sp.]|nr:site-specific tyrosine recombinase XerD [Methylophaga sp.]